MKNVTREDSFRNNLVTEANSQLGVNAYVENDVIQIKVSDVDEDGKSLPGTDNFTVTTEDLDSYFKCYLYENDIHTFDDDLDKEEHEELIHDILYMVTKHLEHPIQF